MKAPEGISSEELNEMSEKLRLEIGREELKEKEAREKEKRAWEAGALKKFENLELNYFDIENSPLDSEEKKRWFEKLSKQLEDKYAGEDRFKKTDLSLYGEIATKIYTNPENINKEDIINFHGKGLSSGDISILLDEYEAVQNIKPLKILRMRRTIEKVLGIAKLKGIDGKRNNMLGGVIKNVHIFEREKQKANEEEIRKITDESIEHASLVLPFVLDIFPEPKKEKEKGFPEKVALEDENDPTAIFVDPKEKIGLETLAKKHKKEKWERAIRALITAGLKLNLENLKNYLNFNNGKENPGFGLGNKDENLDWKRKAESIDLKHKGTSVKEGGSEVVDQGTRKAIKKVLKFVARRIRVPFTVLEEGWKLLNYLNNLPREYHFDKLPDPSKYEGEYFVSKEMGDYWYSDGKVWKLVVKRDDYKYGVKDSGFVHIHKLK